MTENKAPRYTWEEEREHAQTRPAMYIGSQENGHTSAMREALRLVWQARVFRHPKAVTIDLSPTQYIVRAECGPLIRPIQQIFTLGNGERLSTPWREQGNKYFSQIVQEDEQRGIPFSQMRHRRVWRYCLCGPTGPRLDWPAHPYILASSLVWGLRNDEGLWCEAYKDGLPFGNPFCLRESSSIGLLVAADLDPQWFTGLPFTKNDGRIFTEMSHRPIKMTEWQKPLPDWTPGDIIVNWHSQDNLITDETLTADGLRELL